MLTHLAYAQPPESANSTLWMVLAGLLVLLVVGGLMLVPIVLARRRRAPAADLVTTATVFWGLLLAASVLYTVLAEFRWADESALRIRSGYWDPQNPTDAPTHPWWLWAILAVVYALLLLLACRRGRANTKT